MENEKLNENKIESKADKFSRIVLNSAVTGLIILLFYTTIFDKEILTKTVQLPMIVLILMALALSATFYQKK